jgi:hypothetical protein
VRAARFRFDGTRFARVRAQVERRVGQWHVRWHRRGPGRYESGIWIIEHQRRDLTMIGMGETPWHVYVRTGADREDDRLGTIPTREFVTSRSTLALARAYVDEQETRRRPAVIAAAVARRYRP